ncbi:hypothetical protein AB3G45_22165 [Shinella sp. S4-D37]|uniref:hypothetical protein n=1 Tax=Shinella sp. S4-D37 TaxID=3161999 RepID=UPI00346739B7
MAKSDASIASAEAQIAKIDRELDTLLNLILKGSAADAINAKMVTLEQRKKEFVLFVAEADEPPPLLHPNMALQYRKRVQQLHEALRGDEDRGGRGSAHAGQDHHPDAGRRKDRNRRSWRSRWDPDAIGKNAKARPRGGQVASKAGCGGRI